MKANEILQALNLQRNKETIAFTGKLSSLFTFLKLVQSDIIEAAIVETDLTIDEDGKLQTYYYTKIAYVQKMLFNYEYNNKEVKELQRKINDYAGELRGDKDLLWKKRRNKDNSILENEIIEIENNIEAARQRKDILLKAESDSLQSLEFTIEEMRKELKLMTGCKIQVDVERNKGSYSFIVPIDNKFYSAVCDMLKIKYEVKGVIKEGKKEVVKILTMQPIMDSIKKAAKFISNDELRPVMQCICLNFTDNKLQVVATDAHRLYYSKSIEVNMYLNENTIAKSFKPFQLLIQYESVKKLSISKPVKKEIYITLFNDNTALINGIEVNLLPDTKYPDYKAVIPEYESKMAFDREQMISNVKSVMVYSNKSTNQVNLYLNGNIQLSSQDVDFAFESGLSMPYISKEFQDCKIGFNGKFLSEALSIFKTNKVDMYSEGNSQKAAIFTDGIDKVLLMPLMLNY